MHSKGLCGHTLSIVVGIGNPRQGILRLFLRNGNNIIPLRVVAERSGDLPIELSLQCRHFLPPLLFLVDILLWELGAFAASGFPLEQKLSMEDVERSQLSLAQRSLLEFLDSVGANVAAVLVCSPIVVVLEAAAGKSFFGDLLPVLAVGFVREGYLTVCDGEDQPRVGVRLLFSRRQAREADFFEPPLDGVGLVVALLGPLANSHWRGIRRSCRGQRARVSWWFTVACRLQHPIMLGAGEQSVHACLWALGWQPLQWPLA